MRKLFIIALASILFLLQPVNAWMFQGLLHGSADGYRVRIYIMSWDGSSFTGYAYIAGPNQRIGMFYYVSGSLSSDGYLSVSVAGHSIVFIPIYSNVYGSTLYAYGKLYVDGSMGWGSLRLSI